MSDTTLRQSGLIVADNALPADCFAALSHQVARGEYRSVHAQRWDKAWRTWDGHPLRGEAVYFDPQDAFGWQGATYPTHTPLDVFVDTVRQVSANCTDIAGVEGVDWVALYLSPWLYPVGSALSMHQDGQRYSGSFTFFAHARWGVHWGGELLVSPPSDEIADVHDEPWMSDDPDPGHQDAGIAISVSPWPNRLVLIGPDRPHRIARVDSNAGARVRASIAGFFLRPPVNFGR